MLEDVHDGESLVGLLKQLQPQRRNQRNNDSTEADFIFYEAPTRKDEKDKWKQWLLSSRRHEHLSFDDLWTLFHPTTRPLLFARYAPSINLSPPCYLRPRCSALFVQVQSLHEVCS